MKTIQIIDDALRNLKARVEELREAFLETTTPEGLQRFESCLHESLGEFARQVEERVLEEADVEKESVKLNGVVHYRKYRAPQEYQCFFGKIRVLRTVYQANGENRSICPLEINAGIVHHRMTPLAAEFAAYASAHMVPHELAEFCRRWQFMSPCETVIKHTAADIGDMCEKLHESYEADIRDAESTPPEGTKVIAISRDATSVNIRKEGWRHAQVGSISHYGKDRERLQTRYTSQMPEHGSHRFNGKLNLEIEHALESAPRRCKTVCIADGAKGIWTYFRNHELLKNAVLITDFYHAAQHLSAISEALFGHGRPKADRWFKKYRKVLRDEKLGVEKVIRSIDYFASNLTRASEARRATIAIHRKYFVNNKSRMLYWKYRAQGFPIGSGVVEAGCKTIIGQRLKRSGMRWSLEGGQRILNLRVLVLSHRWDYFWRSHQEKVLGAWRVSA